MQVFARLPGVLCCGSPLFSDFLIAVPRNLNYCPQSSGETEAQEDGKPSPRLPDAAGFESQSRELLCSLGHVDT